MNRAPLSNVPNVTGRMVSLRMDTVQEDLQRMATEPVVTIYWSNNTVSPGRPYFAATGQVIGYTIDGEERTSIMLAQRDYPNRPLMYRSIAVSDVIVVEAPRAEPPAGRF